MDPKALPRQVRKVEGAPIVGNVGITSGWSVDIATKMRVFARDGFLNRFTGEQLILPAVLSPLSKELPGDFPYQQAWKLGEVHMAYYDLGACADGVLPPSRGGKEEEGNLSPPPCPMSWREATPQ